MRSIMKLAAVSAAILWVATGFGHDDGPRRDAQAVEVLQAMSDYLAGLERFAVSGFGSSDARLDAGLLVANPIEVELRVQRSGSLHISRFDGESTQHLYVHEAEITLYNTAWGYYASNPVPAGIEPAMQFALDELGIEAPLMDLLYKDVFEHLVGSTDPVLYLTNKSRVGGVDCHHIAIRNAELDIQLWVEEGERPLPRQLVLTSKWEGGAPRFVAQLDWDTEPDLDEGEFEFEPPDGASRIEFTQALTD